MFGLYRTLLASMVVLLHFANIPLIGEYAVFGFFSLSGFLMTLIMQQTYGYTASGMSSYALNRFLRIYPVYWAGCLVAIAVLLTLDPSYTTEFNRRFYLPESPADIFRNVALILEFKSSPMLLSPAWALTVELFFYICIGLGLSRDRKLTLLWFGLSVAYTSYMIATDTPWGTRYYSIGAASMPFATGAMIWHYRDFISKRAVWLAQSAVAPVLLFTAILVNWYLGRFWQSQTMASFYLNYLLCSLMIIALYSRNSLPFVSRRIDTWLGNLSYPMYVVHVPIAYVMHYALEQTSIGFPGQTLSFFLISYPVVILASWLITVGVEARVEALRKRVKKRMLHAAEKNSQPETAT